MQKYLSYLLFFFFYYINYKGTKLGHIHDRIMWIIIIILYQRYTDENYTNIKKRMCFSMWHCGVFILYVYRTCDNEIHFFNTYFLHNFKHNFP